MNSPRELLERELERAELDVKCAEASLRACNSKLKRCKRKVDEYRALLEKTDKELDEYFSFKREEQINYLLLMAEKLGWVNDSKDAERLGNIPTETKGEDETGDR